jgi:hypothetical protein
MALDAVRFQQREHIFPSCAKRGGGQENEGR